MRRVVVPELLDTDAGTPAEVQASLADLRLLNRWFGGASTLRSLLARAAGRTGRRELSLLDVAAGPGEASIGAARQLERRGIRVRVTLLDRAPAHFDGARRSGARVLAADALALPFSADSFDVVACSLFLHHLEPQEIETFVNEALRVARLAVLLSDLRRHPLHLALVYAGFPLFRSRLTRHDAPASVRRAYTAEELSALLGRTRAAQVEITRHYLCRLGAVAWKEPRG